jgi:hypothetical protein
VFPLKLWKSSICPWKSSSPFHATASKFHTLLRHYCDFPLSTTSLKLSSMSVFFCKNDHIAPCSVDPTHSIFLVILTEEAPPAATTQAPHPNALSAKLPILTASPMPLLPGWLSRVADTRAARMSGLKSSVPKPLRPIPLSYTPSDRVSALHLDIFHALANP